MLQLAVVRADIILGDYHGPSRDVVPRWRRKCFCYLVGHSERLARANDGHAPRVHMRTASGVIRQTWPWFAHLKRRGKNFLNGFEQNSFVIQPQWWQLRWPVSCAAFPVFSDPAVLVSMRWGRRAIGSKFCGKISSRRGEPTRRPNAAMLLDWGPYPTKGSTKRLQWDRSHALPETIVAHSSLHGSTHHQKRPLRRRDLTGAQPARARSSANRSNSRATRSSWQPYRLSKWYRTLRDTSRPPLSFELF